MPLKWPKLLKSCVSNKADVSGKHQKKDFPEDNSKTMKTMVLYLIKLKSGQRLYHNTDIDGLQIKPRDRLTLDKGLRSNDIYLMPYFERTILGLCQLTTMKENSKKLSLKWMGTVQISEQFFLNITGIFVLSDMYSVIGSLAEKIIKEYLEKISDSAVTPWSEPKNEDSRTVLNQPTLTGSGLTGSIPFRTVSQRNLNSQNGFSSRKNEFEKQASLRRRDSNSTQRGNFQLHSHISQFGSNGHSGYQDPRVTGDIRQSNQSDNRFEKDRENPNLAISSSSRRFSVNVLIVSIKLMNQDKLNGVLKFSLKQCYFSEFMKEYLNKLRNDTNNSYLCTVNSAARKLGRLARIDGMEITFTYGYITVTIKYSFIGGALNKEFLPNSDNETEEIRTAERDTLFAVIDPNLAQDIYVAAFSMCNSESLKESDVAKLLSGNATTTTKDRRNVIDKGTYSDYNDQNTYINQPLRSTVEATQNNSEHKLKPIVVGNDSCRKAHNILPDFKILPSPFKPNVSTVEGKSFRSINTDNEDRDYDQKARSGKNFNINDVYDDLEDCSYDDRSRSIRKIEESESRSRRNRRTSRERNSDSSSYDDSQYRSQIKGHNYSEQYTTCTSNETQSSLNRKRSDSNRYDSQVDELFEQSIKITHKGALRQEKLQNRGELTFNNSWQEDEDPVKSIHSDELNIHHCAYKTSNEGIDKLGKKYPSNKNFSTDQNFTSKDGKADRNDISRNKGISSSFKSASEATIQSNSNKSLEDSIAYKGSESFRDEIADKHKDSPDKWKCTAQQKTRFNKAPSIPNNLHDSGYRTLSTGLSANQAEVEAGTEIKGSEQNETDIYQYKDFEEAKSVKYQKSTDTNDDGDQFSTPPKQRKLDKGAEDQKAKTQDHRVQASITTHFKFTRKEKNSGLNNIGNTCYMNSVLQCLTIVKWEELQNDMNGSHQFVGDFIRLMVNMTTGSSDVIAPRDLKRSFHSYNTRFSTSNQQDSHEFLTFILYTLRENLSEAGKEFLIGNFRGRLDNVTHVKCPRNHDIIASQDLYTISLPVKFQGSKTVEASIAKFIEDEDLDEEDKVRCKECKAKFCCSLQMCFGKLPPILVLHLKKFDFVTRQKLDVDLKFPFRDLKVPEMNELGKVERVYDLYGVCNHFGSLSSGHYTAFVKSEISGKWYEYNDSSAYQVPEDEVRRSSSTAYLLFYKLVESGTDPKDYEGSHL